jgi:hypothetical protein
VIGLPWSDALLLAGSRAEEVEELDSNGAHRLMESKPSGYFQLAFFLVFLRLSDRRSGQSA